MNTFELIAAIYVAAAVIAFASGIWADWRTRRVPMKHKVFVSILWPVLVYCLIDEARERAR